MNSGNDATASATGKATGKATVLPPTDSSPEPSLTAVAAAEETADACWRLAHVLSATELPGEVVHLMASRLLGTFDALGVIVRSIADASDQSTAPRTEFAWKSADRGLGSAFQHLYRSIPADHPEIRWFIRYADRD
jgi:hypothetical protein